MNQENKGPIKAAINFFDKLEDHVRAQLSRHPIAYTIIGGVAIVLFWRGVWHTADLLEERGGWLGFIFYEPVSLIIVILILLVTGLFVSYFVGDALLMSGLKHEKKVTDKTEREVREEEVRMRELQVTIQQMKKDVDEIRTIVTSQEP